MYDITGPSNMFEQDCSPKKKELRPAKKSQEEK
jgi:hypothetical protein